MAVAFDSTSATGVSGTDTVDNRSIASVAITGTNRFMAVGVSIRNNPGIHISSISRGSDTYTEHAFIEGDSPSTIRVNAAQGVSTNEPQTTSATLTVTIASATANWGFSYHSFTGVDQTTRVDTAQTNEGDGTSSAIATTSATGDMVCDVLAIRNNAHSAAVNGDQSGTDWLYEVTQCTGGGSHAAGASSVNMSWTWTSANQFAHISTNINAASGAIEVAVSPLTIPLSLPVPTVVLGELTVSVSALSLPISLGSVTITNILTAQAEALPISIQLGAVTTVVGERVVAIDALPIPLVLPTVTTAYGETLVPVGALAVNLALGSVAVQQIRTVPVDALPVPVAVPSVIIAKGERAFTVNPLEITLALKTVSVSGGAAPTFTPEYLVTYRRRRNR